MTVALPRGSNECYLLLQIFSCVFRLPMILSGAVWLLIWIYHETYRICRILIADPL